MSWLMAAVASVPGANASSEPWLQRLDRWCERVGDALNPILVKETRQALKSRQFVVTFSVLLFAALAWTIVGSLSLMPQIYTNPSAPRMLTGYYLVLALPMLIVVPLAAYRSLEGEIDDGTLELLSISALSPWQIVLGKLASAMLQMVLYFVALFPCVAYAYTLRGVDLPTTLLMMAILLVAAIVLTIVSLFFAPLSRTRTGRIVTLLAVMGILLAAEWGLAALVIGMIQFGNPLSGDQLLFIVIAAVLGSLAIGNLLLTATAAQLTPETENRSTRLRLALMIVNAVVIFLVVYAMETLGSELAMAALFWGALCLGFLWTLCGSMFAAESPIITPRIRRELPSSFLARATLTWLTPGPVTGLAFAVINILVITAAFLYGLQYMQRGQFGNITAFVAPLFRQFALVYTAYLISFLVAVRWVVSVIRINNHPRVEIGLAALIAVAVLSALVPYSIGLHLNDYRPYFYSYWQITNWVWTLGEVGRGSDLTYIVVIIGGFTTVAFLITVLIAPQMVFPRRTAMPKRVSEELQLLKSGQ